jgi:YD repeat-containing protein
VNPNDATQQETVQTDTSYDAAGRVMQTITGLVTGAGGTVIDPGITTQTFYNEAGQVYETETFANTTTDGTPTNQITYNYYDANGNLVETINPDGTETRTEFDSLNRAVITTDSFVPNSNGTMPSGVIGTLTVYNSLDQTSATETVANVNIPITINSTTGVATVATARF